MKDKFYEMLKNIQNCERSDKWFRVPLDELHYYSQLIDKKYVIEKRQIGQNENSGRTMYTYFQLDIEGQLYINRYKKENNWFNKHKILWSIIFAILLILLTWGLQKILDKWIGQQPNNNTQQSTTPINDASFKSVTK